MSARILIIDDEAAIRKALERALRGFGYEVAAAGDTDSAYLLLSETVFDAVLLDLRLPQTMGDAFYVALVHQWPYLRGRIILMSGDPYTGSEEWPPDLQSCPVLMKPFSLETLAQTLAATLAEKTRRRNGA